MRRSAVIGGVIWILCLIVSLRGPSPFWVIELLFLLAPLVLVPLALAAADPSSGWPRLQPIAALGATASFLVPRGLAAAGLAAGWLLLTGLVAVRGLARLRAHGLRDAAELAITAGMLFLPMGAGWLVLSRLGATPLGFQEPIVLLTAVHFHFAAFTTLTLIGLAGRAAGRAPLYRVVVILAIVGTPLLAAGITLSPSLELLGAATLSGALWLFAWLGLTRVVAWMPTRTSRSLLAISFFSLLPSMALALLFALGRRIGHPVVALADLVAIHAPLNAFGFALAGLLGWNAALPLPPAPVHGE
jgi:YndJ-like protein